MLQLWEQLLFVASADIRLAFRGEYTGVFKYWRELRGDILDLQKPFEPKKYEFPSARYADYFLQAISYNMLPWMLAGWARASRRVYSLTEDMQKTLELTAVGRVRWVDLLPPFPYFVVSLPIPMKGQHGNLIDTLLVECKKGILTIITLGTEFDSVRPLPVHFRKQIGEAVTGRKLEKLQQLNEESRAQQYCYIPPATFLADLCGGLKKPVISDSIGDDIYLRVVDREGIHTKENDSTLVWRPYIRIIIGLILHLELARRGRGKNSVISEPREKWTLDPNAVTNVDEILSVRLRQNLSAYEHEIFRIIREKGLDAAMRELSSHYRSAHWRRPPGQGNNPDHPFDVEVKWTVVNQRRLPPGGSLPSGTNTVL